MVYCPFHIHVAAIVFFNGFGIACQFHHLVIGESLGFCSFFRYLSFFHIAAGLAHQFDGLFIHNAGFDGQISFIDDEIIRCNGALYHVFAQAPGAFDHDAGIVAVGNVHGEHNAGHLGVGHHLDSSGKGYIFMVEMFLGTIVYSTVGKGGCVAFLHLADNHVTAGDIEVGILLACKGSIRQIFSGGGGADCHIGVFLIHFLSQFFVSVADSLCQVFRHFSGNDAFADLGADFMEFHRVFHVLQFLEQFMNLSVLSGGFHEIAVCMSRGSVSVGNGHTGGGGQFTQGRRLPANQCYILSVQFIKP